MINGSMGRINILLMNFMNNGEIAMGMNQLNSRL